MVSAQPERQLTPDEVALALRLLADPDARRSAWEALERTYFNPELWRSAGQAIADTYLNPDLWRALSESIQRTYLNPDLWREAARVLAQTCSPENLRRLAAEAASQYDAEDSHPGLGSRVAQSAADAARDFEREVEAAETTGPELDASASLASWLATRNAQAQVALLIAALTVLDRASVLIQDATGTEVPEGVRDATLLLLAVAVLLLSWLEYQARPPAD